MDELPAGPAIKCAGCEFDRSRGEYVHRVWFCNECLLKMARSNKDSYKRESDHWKAEHESDRRQVAHLETQLGRAHRLGMDLVIASEGLGYISQRTGKDNFEKALRELRDFLCRR